MLYKILPAEPGCNTARMTRVLDGNRLVAMFISYNDATEYIDRKKSEKESKKSIS